jgi:predicted DNA-binding protein with PD1-like motif
MTEFYTLKLKDNEDVIASIHKFMAEKQIELAMPIFAYGKIKNFELLTMGRYISVFSDYSGDGYEVSAISGKVHKDKNGYYTNISVILNKSYATTAHGLLRKALADEFLEIKLRKIDLRNIIEV